VNVFEGNVSPRDAVIAKPVGRVESLRAFLSKGQLRSFSMVGVLIVVWVVLQFLTGGIFLGPRNLTNLSGQVAITAMLAAGAVMVMIPGYIDLSLGATVAACAVIAALVSNVFGFSFWPTVSLTLLFGLAIGLWHALWIAWLRVPAFIVTLASLLAIRGLSLVLTNAETISPSQDMLVISDASLSAPVSIAILFLFWLALAALQIREWRALSAARISASFFGVAILPIASVGVVTACAAFIVASYRGLPVPVAVVMAVVMITGGVLRFTAFGRRLYAIGGNRQAALLSGINIRWHATVVLAGMGLLYGVAGLVLVARLDSAPPGAEAGLELNVIAAAVIGGTSLLGGRGTVVGAILGALLMESLSNGMSLMNLPSAYQAITVGLVLLLAVYADIRSRGSSAFD
jgi:ABC-type xylose transport system permease subunit